MNYGRYIEDCIQSVLGQKAGFPFKINHLIMDGGSTDETAEILEKYDHVYYRVDKGKGQTSALNRAMKIIEVEFPETEYIGWLNADDYYALNWLESSITTHKHESYDVAMTCSNNTMVIIPTQSKGSGFVEVKITNQDPRPYVDLDGLLEANSICQPTVCIKLSAFNDVKERDGYYFRSVVDYCQDYETWIRFLLHGYKIRRIRDYLATLRQHNLRLTETHSKRQAVEESNLREVMRSKRRQMKK